MVSWFSSLHQLPPLKHHKIQAKTTWPWTSSCTFLYSPLSSYPQLLQISFRPSFRVRDKDLYSYTTSKTFTYMFLKHFPWTLVGGNHDQCSITVNDTKQKNTVIFRTAVTYLTHKIIVHISGDFITMYISKLPHSEEVGDTSWALRSLTVSNNEKQKKSAILTLKTATPRDGTVSKKDLLLIHQSHWVTLGSIPYLWHDLLITVIWLLRGQLQTYITNTTETWLANY